MVPSDRVRGVFVEGADWLVAAISRSDTTAEWAPERPSQCVEPADPGMSDTISENDNWRTAMSWDAVETGLFLLKKRLLSLLLRTKIPRRTVE